MIDSDDPTITTVFGIPVTLLECAETDDGSFLSESIFLFLDCKVPIYSSQHFKAESVDDEELEEEDPLLGGSTFTLSDGMPISPLIDCRIVYNGLSIVSIVIKNKDYRMM